MQRHGTLFWTTSRHPELTFEHMGRLRPCPLFSHIHHLHPKHNRPSLKGSTFPLQHDNTRATAFPSLISQMLGNLNISRATSTVDLGYSRYYCSAFAVLSTYLGYNATLALPNGGSAQVAIQLARDLDRMLNNVGPIRIAAIVKNLVFNDNRCFNCHCASCHSSIFWTRCEVCHATYCSISHRVEASAAHNTPDVATGSTEVNIHS